MSTLTFPKASTGGPTTATDRVTMRAAAILTNSDVDTDDVNVMGLGGVQGSIIFTKGSLTSLRMTVWGWDGTEWQQLAFKATQSAGYSLVTPDLLEFTASYTGGLPKVETVGFQRMKFSLIGNGTATSSSAKITAGGYIRPVLE